MEPLSPLSMEARNRLSALKDAFDQAAAHLIGYPTNQNFDFSELLPFLQYSANNVGRPLSRQQLPGQYPRNRTGGRRPFRRHDAT